MRPLVTTDAKVAANYLDDGKVVVFPTETVYGLGAKISKPDAVQRIYNIKKRPLSHPLIVHIGNEALLDRLAIDIPNSAQKLISQFWPGPLTLVLKKSASVPSIVTAGQDTVAIRFPSHPMARALLKQINSGVVGPSANKFGRLSPTNVKALEEELLRGADLVLDGGHCSVGIESTIVGFEGEAPVLLRPGMITRDQISGALDQKVRNRSDHSPKVSGSLPSHYAPKSEMRLVSGEGLDEYLKNHDDEGVRFGVLTFRRDFQSANCAIVISAPLDPFSYATLLYESLQRIDAINPKLILVESVPQTEEWEGIRDRLERAAT